MPRYDYRACEDVTRMAESILSELGFVNVSRWTNRHNVDGELSYETVRTIAVLAERIARWARGELKRKNEKMGTR
jgi:hypothetical protein